jgi:hypothetical protein
MSIGTRVTVTSALPWRPAFCDFRYGPTQVNGTWSNTALRDSNYDSSVRQVFLGPPAILNHGKIVIVGVMPKMRTVQVLRPNTPFEMVEREIPEPGPGSVRIKVQA